MTGQTILVTGASGFIGAHLCTRLKMLGDEVHGVARSDRPEWSACHYWWQADMEDIDALYHLLDTIKPEIIFHLAGYVTANRELELVLPTFRSCLVGTVNLLVAVAEKNKCRLLLTGSSEEAFANDASSFPTSPYAAAKEAATAYGQMFHHLYKLPVIIVRPFVTFGPLQQTNKLVPYVIKCALQNQPPLLTSGTRLIDWIYVDDVVEGMIAAVQINEMEGQSIDLGTGMATSVQTMVEHIIKLTGAKIQPIFGGLSDRPFDQIRVADIHQTQKIIDWQPKVSLEQGLKETIKWYQSKV